MRKSGFVTWGAFQAHLNKPWQTSHNIYPNIRGITIAPRPKGSVGAHTHPRSEITDFWDAAFWGNIPDKPSTFPPSAHAASHEDGGGDALAFVDIAGFGDYIDQAVKQDSSPIFEGLTITPTAGVSLTLGRLNGIASIKASVAAGHLIMDSTGAGNHVYLNNYNSGNVLLAMGGGDVGIEKFPTEKLDVNGIVKATTFQGNLHWDYITNEPTYYPPEYHYHVGKDIISLHLVDLDDVEAEDIFDVLPTAAIHGEGNYDWWGTWNTTAAANTSAEVVVLLGDDKMLQLTDNNNAGDVQTELTADPGHVMVTGVMEFQICQSATNKRGWILFLRDAQQNMGIYMSNDGDMYLIAGGASHQILTYAANTWYKIRLHYDCVARACVLFVDNVFEFKKDLAAGASGDFVNNIQVRTFATDTGYTLDINKLKVFNLTI